MISCLRPTPFQQHRFIRVRLPETLTISSLLNFFHRFGSKGKRTRLMVFGDSNAYRPGNGRNCWPAMLQRISGNRLQVINESVDGRTTRYDTGECNGLGVIENKLRDVWPLTYVLVALGTNDVKVRYGPPEPAAVVGGMDRIISSIKSVSGDIQSIILVPPPLGNVTSGDLAGAQGRIPPVVAEYRRYAAKQNIPIIDLYSTLDADIDLESDRVHINASGRRKVAAVVWGYFLAQQAAVHQYLTSI